jgi:hypothetical protein
MKIEQGRTPISYILLGVFCIFSCYSGSNKSSEIGGNSRYLVALRVQNEKYYPYHVLSVVDSGEADISEARSIENSPYNVLVTTKPGIVFLNSRESLTKYSVDSCGMLKAEGAVSNTGLLGGPISAFLDDRRLLVSTSPRQVEDSLFIYQIIDIESMREESRGHIILPVGPDSLAAPSIYIEKEGKVLVPYFITDKDGRSGSKALLAVYDAENMDYEGAIYTDKTACLGYSVVSSHAFTENGDLYLASSNSNFWGANESMPSGIVCIRAGATEFDDDYFLNLTSKLGGNHTGGMIYAGRNKVIVQVFESKLIKAYADYQHGFVISYYEVDLLTGNLKKLDIPLAKYPRHALARLEDGRVAIAVNAQNGENAFFIYDSSDGQVRKGLSYRNADEIIGLMTF